MKSKIAQKLLISFLLSLVIFSSVIGLLFAVILNSQAEEIFKEDMKKRAEKVSVAITNNLSISDNHSRLEDVYEYIALVNEFSTESVWIFDSELNSLQTGHSGHGNGSGEGNEHGKTNNINPSDLPPNSEDLINEALEGETVYITDFSPLLTYNSITVGVPIFSNDLSEIIGVTLMHSSIGEMHSASISSIKVLLISLFVATIISIPISILLSLKFTKPLSLMKENAIKLANGDYSKKNNLTASDEIGELGRTLDILSQKLYNTSLESEKLENLRRDFIANISHELRTPVTVIRGGLEAFRDNLIKTEEKADVYHRQMYEETIYLQRLINDLLELSRMQNVDFEISKENIDLQELCDDTLRSAEYIANKKNINIKVSFYDGNTEFNGDYSRIRQMLLVILDNAIKFSDENSTIEFTLENQNDRNIIKICDFGKGISKEELPLIFDRFYKAKDEINKKGTGLGLAIAKELCLRQNIEITAQSEGGITTFILVF